jgi:hypothetical protein
MILFLIENFIKGAARLNGWAGAPKYKCKEID